MCAGDHRTGLEALDAESAAAHLALADALTSPTAPLAPGGLAILQPLLDALNTATGRQITARDAIIADLLDLIQKKNDELHDHRRQRFGQKSEKDTDGDAQAAGKTPNGAIDKSTGADRDDADGKADGRDGSTDDDAETDVEDASADSRSETTDQENTNESGGKRGPKKPRKPRSDLAEQPEPDEVLHHEPESLICAACGGKLRIKGYDPTLRKCIVEAHIRFIQERYAITSCDGCERVEQVPRAPNLFAGSTFDASVFAAIAVQKFAASTSLYTLDKVIFSKYKGLNRSYMSRLLIYGADIISDLWDATGDYVLSQKYISLDETTLPVQGVVKGKAHRGYGFGIMAGGTTSLDAPDAAVFFKYSNVRTGEFAEKMLKGFNGACTVDKFSGYLRFCKVRTQKGLSVRIMFCHAHARRNFEKIAKKNKSPIARQMVKYYKMIYAVEKEIRGASPEERSRVRRAKALPILREIRAYLLTQRERLPQTGKLADAVAYIIDHFREFRRYCLIGSANIDNNPLERAIRRWAVTRRSSLFAGSPKGARTWSILSTVIETCKLHDVDPFRYLTWYCRKKAEGGASFDPKLYFPWHFKAHPDYETFKASELPRSTMLKSQRAASASPQVVAA